MSLEMEPIRRSLHRHMLFLGGDRELVMLSALGAFIVATGFTLYAFIAAAVFWLTALYWIRSWTKNDPMIKAVFWAYRKQQNFYPAKSLVWVQVSAKDGFRKK